MRSFFKFYNSKPIELIDNNDIIIYNNEFIIKNKLSASYQNQIINAIKLFFKTIEYKKMEESYIQRPKSPKSLPNVLSKEEVKMILNALANVKHKTMLSLIYSCGLRSGELIGLKMEHVDSNRQLLIIKNGKGMKDRIVPLGQKTIEMLRTYYNVYKPKKYLFEGQQAL